MEDTAEDRVWKDIDPNHIWVMDKLILARKLGYACGPVGLDVPKPGWYIVRPCVNMQGMGLGAQKVWIEDLTIHLPIGYFWCEFFKGRHLSIDYAYGKPTLKIEGFKEEDTFMKWDKWKKVDDWPAIECVYTFPEILNDYRYTYPVINCEFIGNKLIEVHFRENEDFKNGISEFIPVWKGQNIDPPQGYKYILSPDQDRIGAYVK